MSALIWAHDDALSPHARVFAEAHCGGAYILDPAFIEAQGYGLKRLTFLTECALELPVSLYKGDFAQVLASLAQAMQADQILCMEPVDPYLRRTVETLREQIPVETMAPDPFVVLSGRVDLKRFSRYWKKAQEPAFLPTIKQL